MGTAISLLLPAPSVYLSALNSAPYPGNPMTGELAVGEQSQQLLKCDWCSDGDWEGAHHEYLSARHLHPAPAWPVLGLGMQAHAQTGTVTYVYTDLQGTPLVHADAQGNIIARYDYTPYGNPVASLNGAPDGPSYTGHVYDPESGLVYMQQRYYQAIGRFPSPDPVGPSAGNVYSFNRYAYANNNPIRNIDPTGMADVSADCAGRATCSENLQQNVNIVHQHDGKTVVDSTISISMRFSKTTDSKGNASWSVSASVSNVSGKAFSNSQLSTMSHSLDVMQSAAIGRGFGAFTTQMVTAIGLVETHLGIYSAPSAPAFKAGAINPMQLSGGRANMSLDHNVRGAMDVLQWAGHPSNYDPTSTYGRYSDGGTATMADWDGTYGSLSELSAMP